MLNFFKVFSHLPTHLFISSFVVFIILNLFENMLHYSIGKESNKEKVSFQLPTKVDWIRIIIVMLVFAILQAILTCLLNGC